MAGLKVTMILGPRELELVKEALKCGIRYDSLNRKGMKAMLDEIQYNERHLRPEMERLAAQLDADIAQESSNPSTDAGTSPEKTTTEGE